MDDGISILNLRTAPDENLLKEFIVLYEKTFTDPLEREDPMEWPKRMWQDAPSPQPATHLLVALSSDNNVGDRYIVGGLVFEHYRRSHCGLLTYLVVEKAWRRKGIARKLIDEALSTLIQEEHKSGDQLLAAFCEIEDPRLIQDKNSAIPTCQRLNAFLELGARPLGLKYIQPTLAGGAGPCDHLLLLGFNLKDYVEDTNDRLSEVSISGSIVYDFLHEFYQALGVDKPEEDRIFQKMAKHLHREVALFYPREEPVLELEKVAVCLHYVSPCPRFHAHTSSYPKCNVFQSIELDLMSYGYQIQKLLGSKVELLEPIPLEIEFPEYVEYHSEGRDMLLIPVRRTCRVRAIVSSTLFLVSGIRVWHVVLVPESGEIFTEYDIIKLIHLYDGRTENTDLRNKVKFRVNPENSDSAEVFVDGLLGALLKDPPDQPINYGPTAGTVQIITGNEARKTDSDLTEIMKTVQLARNSKGEQDYENLKRLIAEGTSQGKALLALCGVIMGIFDFNEVDEEEVLDIMEPTFSSAGSLIRINRCTIISISDDDRVMEGVIDSVGLSPYLLLPHAALLHNEALIEDSIMAMPDVNNLKGVRLSSLEDARERMERNLYHFYLPNIFNYLTEKTLFTKGAEGRGTSERFAATRARLQELNGEVKAAWEQRHDRGQKRIAALLSVFTVVGLKSVLFEIMKGTAIEPLSWWVLLGLVGVVVLLINLRD